MASDRCYTLICDEPVKRAHADDQFLCTAKPGLRAIRTLLSPGFASYKDLHLWAEGSPRGLDPAAPRACGVVLRFDELLEPLQVLLCAVLHHVELVAHFLHPVLGLILQLQMHFGAIR